MTERDDRGEQLRAAAASEGETGPPPVPSMTTWGRRAAKLYLVVGALALVAMAVESTLGHPGTGSMFAAMLAVPWSMLVAGFAPQLPRDWPLAAGLAVRMAPLALFMLLNAAIVAGIAARSERDLTGRGARALAVVALLGLAGALSSGCGLTSKQVVLVAAPRTILVLFNGGSMVTVLRFDLTQAPAWTDHRANLKSVSDLTLMGDFSNQSSAALFDTTGVPLDMEIAATSIPDSLTGTEPVAWGQLHLAPRQSHRVDWNEGMARLQPAVSIVRQELKGDGQFLLIVRSILPAGAIGGAGVANFRLGAVLQVK